MNELVPLLDTSENSRTRALLRAGRSDAAPRHFSQRMLAGLGLAGAATSLTAVASAHAARSAIQGAASSGSGASSLVLVAVKWVAVGVVGGGILAGGASTVFVPRARPPAATLAAKPVRAGQTGQRTAPRASVAPHALPPPAPEASAALAEQKPLKASAPDPAPAATNAPPSKQDGQLGYEVRVIDRAREALAANDFSRALLELDTFDRIAKTGVLDREGRILRIDVLSKLGQSDRARALAEQYLQRYPDDAHATRLRALVQGPGQH